MTKDSLTTNETELATTEQEFATLEKTEDALTRRETECFAGYGLSPRPKTRRDGTTFNFDDSMKKLMREMKEEWEQGGTKERKILLFLYSRGFRVHVGQRQRKSDMKSSWIPATKYELEFYRYLTREATKTSQTLT